ncbi:hypothetical protein DFA_11146 [Cavenderia fasciculata]|uniref:Uncharacterized protein n=1 Tax=Cavenderia fasciculata TaxID=261658 RepID=F4QF26_CACFS|nr:uncharacterized protein DFA_11146 [Cavenderia fasciculata]EGG13385.1 hypothetical protein DFA_11146 [Cavenderia fasciculata]|eukprot:XP_004350089.1 hypothetical protein DFA_11146 [Cavenderia fasciculata]
MLNTESFSHTFEYECEEDIIETLAIVFSGVPLEDYRYWRETYALFNEQEQTIIRSSTT